jgi:hypothetical protein
MNPYLLEKAEHQVVASFIDNFDNTSRNKFYQFQKDTISLFEIPASEFKTAQKSYRSKYKLDEINTINIFLLSLETDWHSPRLGTVVGLILDFDVIGADLINAMNRRDAQNRMLNLYVQIKARNIPDDQISNFLNNTSSSLYNPFTDKPFTYDTKTKSISFEYESNGKITPIALKLNN